MDGLPCAQSLFPRSKGHLSDHPHKHFCSDFTPGRLMLCPQLLLLCIVRMLLPSCFLYLRLSVPFPLNFSQRERKESMPLLIVEGRERGEMFNHQTSPVCPCLWVGGRKRQNLNVGYTRSNAQSCFGSRSCGKAQQAAWPWVPVHGC